MTTISEAIVSKLIDPVDTIETEDNIVWPEDLGIQNDMLGEEIIAHEIAADNGGVGHFLALKVDKKTLRIGEESQDLTPAETRSLNILLLNRRTPIKSRLIQEITDTGKSMVIRSLNGLLEKLVTQSGMPLIVRDEKEATYAVHPVLEIVESADLHKEDVTLPMMRRKLMGDFIAAQAVDDPVAQAKLRRYGSLAIDGEGRGKYEQLTPKKIEPLFEQFDQGAIRYSHTNDMSDEAVAQGLIAWHKIFYSGLGIARSFAFSYLRRNAMEGRRDIYDDYFQIGSVALWNATLSFDKEKASFVHHAMLRINTDIGHHLTNERRHRYLSTVSMLREWDKDINQSRPAGDRTKAILGEEALSTVDPIQLCIAQMTQRSLVRRVFNHELLRPSEALVLSLGYGIHSNTLDGLELDTPSGTLVYSEDLEQNPVFMQGLSSNQIAEIIGLSVRQVNRIHLQALQKAHDIIVTDLYTKADQEEFERSGAAALFL